MRMVKYGIWKKTKEIAYECMNKVLYRYTRETTFYVSWILDNVIMYWIYVRIGVQIFKPDGDVKSGGDAINRRLSLVIFYPTHSAWSL